VSKTRVLLVDDHALLRAGIRALLDRQEDFQVIAEASNVAEALAVAARERPDLLVLDLTMPGGGSLELAKRLQEKAIPTRVLVLSMHDDPAYARAAIAGGALGYVVKTISEQDLLDALRSVRRGHLIVDLDDEAKTAAIFSKAPPAAKGKNALAKLSERELEVLMLLGQGHSNQAVAEQLDISPKTVATYRARIGEKLGIKSTPEFVKYVADTGLGEKPPSPS
jgi:two-component system, NarL family, response regulator NreC